MVAKNGSGYRRARSLHFWLGVLTGLVVLLLASTGVLLNHSVALQLDQRYVTSQRLLDWYGVKIPEQFLVFHAGAHRVVDSGDRIYLDKTEMAQITGPLSGVTAHPEFLLLAQGANLILLTPSGQLVEKVPLDIPVRQVGQTPDGLLAIAGEGGLVRFFDLERMAWDDAVVGDRSAIRWSRGQRVGADALPDIAAKNRARRVSLERFLQELHSGRIFGTAGVWVVDATALILIAQLVTGLLLWRKSKA